MNPQSHTQVAQRIPQLFEVVDGAIHWHPHQFQQKASDSYASRTFILKGWRGGATSWGAKWLFDEMVRCGPGNLNLSYFAISPTHKVGSQGLLPAIQTVFCTHLGIADYNKSSHTFTINEAGEQMMWGHKQKEPTQIIGCYAEDPDSFASATFISGVGDELVQKKFKRESYNTLEARMATTSSQVAPNNRRMGFPGWLRMGRIYGGSTVYQLGWLQDLWNAWLQSMKDEKARVTEEAKYLSPEQARALWADFNRRAYHGLVHPEYNFIRYDSTANPLISDEFFEKKRRELPDWFFDMRYRAIFRKPAGVIFEDWDESRHVVPGNQHLWKLPFDIAIDFGKRNFRAQRWAYDADRGRHWLTASYRDSTHSNAYRAAKLLDVWGYPAKCVAGQPSENDDRAELGAGGLVAEPPAWKPLWSGINTMGAGIKTGRVFVFDGKPYEGMPTQPQDEGFEHGSQDFRDEVKGYSRPVDEDGKVKLDEDPEDKETYHSLDAPRYLFTYRLSDLYNGDQTPRAAGQMPDTSGKQPMAQVLAGAAMSEAETEAAMMGGGAGVAMSEWGESFAQRYGMGSGGAYLDVDL